MNSSADMHLAAFRRRVGHGNIVPASLWLFVYASLPTLAIAALIVSTISYYSPEGILSISASAAQKDPQWIPSLVFNPLLETLLLIGILHGAILLKFGGLSAIVAAVALSAIHSLLNIYWGLTVFSFFLIQSYAYTLAYADKFKRGFAVITLTHSLHNAWVLMTLACMNEVA